MTENTPSVWKQLLPRPATDGHKYDRGHAVVLAADELTGATRLAATACSRMGAGLVTVISPARADFFRAVLPPDIMVRGRFDPAMRGITAVLAGPGGGGAAAQLPDLAEPFFRILDAGALPEAGNYETIDAMTVLTPHDGEFSRAFPDATGERTERALAAARACGGIVVLKGAETVIAAPDGQLVELLRFHSHPDSAQWNGTAYSTGLTHIALTVDNLDQLLVKLKQAGVSTPASPQHSPDGDVKVIYAKGPEGILLELVEVLTP